jgi:imidazoleglycerol-phosphate dehydratase/histidinol-phosphatase
MKKILFIDRDWTLIQESPITFQVNNLEEMVFLPKVISSLAKFIKSGYELVIVTNQDWLDTPLNSRENYEKVNKKMLEIFSWEWIEFSEFFECPHFPEDNCDCRKPKIWILSKEFLEKYSWSTEGFNPLSYMIWDRDSDKEFAENIWVNFEKVIFGSEEENWEIVTKKILLKK